MLALMVFALSRGAEIFFFLICRSVQLEKTMPLEKSQADAFTWRVVPEREYVRLVPVGELDLSTVPLVEREARALVASGFTRLVLDLREIRYMDSSGLHLLLRLQAESSTDDFRFEVINGSAQVRRLFEITDMASRLPFVSPGDLSCDRQG